MDRFVANFAAARFNCVSDLKTCNYIVNDRQHCLEVYYPTLRTKKLIESCPPIEVHVKAPNDDYDACLAVNKDRIVLVCLSGTHNSGLFIQMSDFPAQGFAP